MKNPITHGSPQRHRATEKIKSGFLKIPQIFAVVLAVSLCLCGPRLCFAKPPVVPATPPLRITVPNIHVRFLSCGMKVLFLKNDEMPLVSATLLIPGGNVLDPDGKEGLAGLSTALMRNGGAGDLKPEAFDEALENRAAAFTCESEQEDFKASFNCLSGDVADILKLFADMVLRPQMDPLRLATDKATMADSLTRTEDTPDSITRVLFTKALFGHHPYGRWSTPKVASQLTRDDAMTFYKKHFGPKGAVLAVAGKFDEDQVFTQLDSLFGGWKEQEPGPVFTDGAPLGPAIYFFPKDVTQVFVRLGLPGLKRHDPRDIPLQVANYVFGGSGFTSRLMSKIRSDRGLAYFVDSYFLPYNITGPFQIVGGTRPDSVKEYLSLMFDQMALYAQIGPTPKELDEAKQSMIEEFAYNFESPFDLVAYRASLDFNDYPDDYLAQYREKVKSVTLEQAALAAQDILSRKDWVLVVCGPAELEGTLKGFGKVVTVKTVFDPLPSNP